MKNTGTIIVISLVAFVILCLLSGLIFFAPNECISKVGIFFQAAGIIILSAITVYYAIQTHIQASEMIKSRRLDLLRRKTNFFGDFLDVFYPLKKAYGNKDRPEIVVYDLELSRLLVKSKIWFPDTLISKIQGFKMDLMEAAKNGKWDIAEQIWTGQETAIVDLVVNEHRKIEAEIDELSK